MTRPRRSSNQIGERSVVIEVRPTPTLSAQRRSDRIAQAQDHGRVRFDDVAAADDYRASLACLARVELERAGAAHEVDARIKRSYLVA